MSIDEYRYFIAAYNCRSFSDAARKTNISSQGLGKAIRSLEAQLGVKLFERTSQGIVPTPVATKLHDSINLILEEEDRIREIAATTRNLVGEQVLLGRDSRMGDAIGAGVEEYCKKSGASIKVLLTRDPEDEHARQLVELGYDYRFLSSELDTLPALPREPICMLHYLPVVGAKSPLAFRSSISIEDLRGRTVLTDNLTNTPMMLLAEMCRERGFEPTFRAVARTYIWDLLCNSADDVTFIRTNEVNEYPWMSKMYVKLTMDPPLDTQIVLQTSHDAFDPELVECIRESLVQRDFDQS